MVPTAAADRGAFVSQMKMHTDRTIRNCTVRIDTPCPQRWDELQVTDSPNVRHCHVCARDVFFCSSAEETLEHARAGHCIAREEPHASELPRMVLGRPTVVPVVTNEQERARAVGASRARNQHPASWTARSCISTVPGPWVSGSQLPEELLRLRVGDRTRMRRGAHVPWPASAMVAKVASAAYDVRQGGASR
jgi:hypothetical protein